MGVYIKGMEMPKDCYWCKLRGIIDCSPLKGLSPYDAVKDCPLIETDNIEWILPSERLPEKKGKYLVTIPLIGKKYFDFVVHICVWTGNEWIPSNSVIAWKPLPKPYKESEDK